MDKNFVKKDLLPLIIRLAVIATVFIAVIINYDRLVNIDVRQLVSSVPGELLPIILCIAVFGLKGLTFVIPAMLVYVSVGMAFELPTALFISLTGIALELSVTYWLGRALGGEYVGRLLKKVKGGDKILNMKDKSKFSSIFAIRFVGLPIDFTSLFLGSMRIPFFRYLLVSFLGIAPRVILFTLTGDGIYETIPMPILLKVVLAALPIAAAVFTVSWIVKRKKKKAQN